MTLSNGNIFHVTGLLYGEFTGPGEFPTQRPVTRSFDVFFDLRLNKRLSKQPWGWWFETLSRPLWRHRNVCVQNRRSFHSCFTRYVTWSDMRKTPSHGKTHHTQSLCATSTLSYDYEKIILLVCNMVHIHYPLFLPESPIDVFINQICRFIFVICD